MHLFYLTLEHSTMQGNPQMPATALQGAAGLFLSPVNVDFPIYLQTVPASTLWLPWQAAV